MVNGSRTCTNTGCPCHNKCEWDTSENTLHRLRQREQHLGTGSNANLPGAGYVMCDCHAAATFGSFANKHVTGNRKLLLLVGHWLNQAAMPESHDTPATIICLVMTIDQKVFKV